MVRTQMPLGRLFILQSIDTSKLDPEKFEVSMKEFASTLPANLAEFNRRVAEDNGISVETLVNSPNYEILKAQSFKIILSQLAEKIQKEFELTKEQADALVAEAVDGDAYRFLGFSSLF